MKHLFSYETLVLFIMLGLVCAVTLLVGFDQRPRMCEDRGGVYSGRTAMCAIPTKGGRA